MVNRIIIWPATFITGHTKIHNTVKAGTAILDIKTLLSTIDKSFKHFPDRGAKWLLENTENLRGLLEIIASDLVEHFDFSRVKIENTTFISDDLRQQVSDLVYLLPFREKANASAAEVMIYILVEHQSTVDRTMGLRLLSYMCQIWERQRREYITQKVPKGEWRFQPIIPIVFYTGEQKWEMLPSLETLMDLPEALSRFLPRFDVLLLDVKRAADETLVQSDHPFGWLLTVLKEEESDIESFVKALLRFGDHLQSLPEAERSVWQQAIYYLYLLIFFRRSVEEQAVLEQIVSETQPYLGISEEEEQLMQSMAEHYFQQGREQGAHQTSIETTLNILTERFSNVDANQLRTRLEAITDLNRLKQLSLNAAIAESFNAFQEALNANSAA